MSVETGIDAPIDVVLDAGAVGLRYFTEFLPRAARVHPHSVSVEQLYARYDEQRGLDTAAMQSDADVLGRALGMLDEQLRDQHARVRALDASWSGDAADSARAFLDSHLQRARHDRDTLAAAHAAIGEAARALRVVVTDKADTVGAFPDRIDGKSPADIDEILRGASLRPSDGHGSVLGTVATIFTDIAPLIPGGAPTSALLGQVADRCTQWLTEVFVPHVEEYLRNYDELCTVTDSAVRDIFARVAAAVDAVDDSPYPAPDAATPTVTGTRSQAVPTPTPDYSAPLAQPSEGNSAVPQHVPAAPHSGDGQSAPVQTPLAQVTPPSVPTQPAPMPQPQLPQFQAPQLFAQSLDGRQPSSLGGLVGELAKNVAGVVNDAITGVVDQFHHDPGTEGEGPDGDVKPDVPAPSEGDASKPDTDADFDVHGKHLHFEQQPDGDLTVGVTGPEKTFDLSVDDSGAPVVTDPAAPEPGPEPEPAEAEAPQSHASEPAPTEDAAPQSDSAPQAAVTEEQQSYDEPEPQSSGAESAMQLQSSDRRESNTSGEPQLASTTSDEPEDPPDGTGAMLAEAGPL